MPINASATDGAVSVYLHYLQLVLFTQLDAGILCGCKLLTVNYLWLLLGPLNKEIYSGTRALPATMHVGL